MKHLKTFEFFESRKHGRAVAAGPVKDFDKEVKKLDKKYSDAGTTCDADDIRKELVKSHGEKYKQAIKDAVDRFYNS